MLNKKGQTLIFFVVILPVLLFIFMFVIDLGYMNYEKTKLDNLAKECVSYKLDGKKNKEVIKFIRLNSNDVEYDIYVNKVILRKKYSPIFLNFNLKEIKSVYVGYKSGNKNVIKKGD